jgi:hypothetical protein
VLWQKAWDYRYELMEIKLYEWTNPYWNNHHPQAVTIKPQSKRPQGALSSVQRTMSAGHPEKLLSEEGCYLESMKVLDELLQGEIRAAQARLKRLLPQLTLLEAYAHPQGALHKLYEWFKPLHALPVSQLPLKDQLFEAQKGYWSGGLDYYHKTLQQKLLSYKPWYRSLTGYIAVCRKLVAEDIA